MRLIALPTEHGGWGLLGAPILLGLLLAPSAAGALLAMAALGAFLARHPAKLAFGDFRRGKRYPRTTWALRFLALYSACAAVGLVAAAFTARGNFLPSLMFCLTIAALDLWIEFSVKGRSLASEILGASTLALLVWPIVVAGGRSPILGVLAALLLALQSTAALLYVRARLRLEREGSTEGRPAYLMGTLGLALALSGALFAQIFWWTLPLFALLMIRIVWGLSKSRLHVRPAIVGLQEVGYTLFSVLAIYMTIR